MNLKRVLLGAVILAALLLGGLWAYLRAVAPSATLSNFQQTCVEGQRRGISGDTQRLDDGTEARLLAFCDCVAQEVEGRLSAQDIAAIGLEQSSASLDAKLEGIFALCQARNP